MRREIGIFFINIAYNLQRLYWMLTNTKTRGVKPLIIDGDSVLLVVHTYGEKVWKLSGGGMKNGESIEQVAKRELKEELDLVIHTIEYNLGTYSGYDQKRYDTSYIPVVKKFTWNELDPTKKGRGLSAEIKEARFFNLNNLPINIDQGVKRRILEYIDGKKDLENVEW